MKGNIKCLFQGMPAPSSRAPTEPSGLTTQWLQSALAERFPGISVRAVVCNAPLYGTATKIRLQAEYEISQPGLPASLVVKAGFAAHREAMSYLYAHETRFYREVQPLLGINTPDCYATVDDPAVPQHMALLEDLDASGATFCRVHHPLNYQQTSGFLDILARMHARTWSNSLINPGGPLADLKIWEALPNDAEGTYARGQLVPEVWAHYMTLPRALALPRIFHDRKRMQSGLLALNELCRSEPYCLLHGDFHLGNLYFDGKGRPAVLDWQSYSRGNWSHDVTYFMVSALDPVDRRRWDRALMAHYLDRLQQEGVAAPPSLDAAMLAFRLQILDGLFYWTVNPPEWQAEENNCSVAPRFAYAALDHGSYDAF